MSYPSGHMTVFEFDESQAGNLKTVDAGHVMLAHWGHVSYVCDATVSTRTIRLKIDPPFTPNLDYNFTVYSQTAGQNEVHPLGYEDSGPGPLIEYQQFPGTGLWLPAGTTVAMVITNEESGDTWDVQLVVTDFVVPRA